MQKPAPITRSPHFQVNYLYSGIAQYRPGDVLKERFLDDFEFVHILQGSPTYVANGKHYSLKAGSIVCGRPGLTETYYWDRDDLTIHSYFHFSIQSLPQDIPPLEKWPLVIQEPSLILGALIEEVVKLSLSNTTTVMETHPSIIRTTEALIDRYTSFDKSYTQARADYPPPIQQALILMRNAIEAQTSNELTLDRLAQAASVHKQHLCKLFQQHFALSPMQTLRLMQLQLGVGLLIRSGLSIKEIALRCGFEDALYFSRYFKKILKESPSSVRNKIHSGQLPPRVPLPIEIAPARLYW